MLHMEIRHEGLKAWVDEMVALAQPDQVVVIDGSNEQRKALSDEAVTTGEFIELNQDELPNCYLHRSHPNDVARTEELTFICTQLKDDVGPTNNWLSPEEGYRRAAEITRGAMKGRTMYVIPFSMGPVGSPFAKIGVELTDSIYVAVSMMIMTRVGEKVLGHLGKAGEFTKCMHTKADLDIKRRLILHFPEDNTIWSVGSGYGGNALLGKKCLALRLASFLAKKEGWLAEHMLILGVERPNGRIQYIAAAFPSACGKTNLAMMIPPAGLERKGFRVFTVGDDIAWMRIDTDGRLWAVNPENGFFGVAPGTNWETNPNAMKSIQKNALYTNVALRPDNTVWWEDGPGAPPAEAIDWKGRPWKPGLKDESGKPVPAAHANSRYTAPLSQCPSLSYRVDHHHGVPIDAILFGGRRSTLAPLIYETYNWQHGVYVGATMASERTAAQTGEVGNVRRDPMAMLPFCGYNMADYFEHWLRMGVRMEKRPKVFHVNWFRRDENGKFLWPGFGENLRVLDWALSRCDGEVEAERTAIGYVPRPDDLMLDGLDLPEGALAKLLAVPKDEWAREADDIAQFLQEFGERLPLEMLAQHEALQRRLDILG